MDDILRRVLGEDIALDLLLDPNLGWVKVDRGSIAADCLEPGWERSRAMPQGGRLSIETKDVSVSGARLNQSHSSGMENTSRSWFEIRTWNDAETRARIFDLFSQPRRREGTARSRYVYGIVKAKRRVYLG